MAEWMPHDQRQYDHIKQTYLDQGKSEDQAQEIAARTVNKQRREDGKTPNQATQGTGNPHLSLDDRTVDELRNRAAELDIDGRSDMKKDELIRAIRDRNA